MNKEEQIIDVITELAASIKVITNALVDINGRLEELEANNYSEAERLKIWSDNGWLNK